MNYIDIEYRYVGKWGVPSQCGLKIVNKDEKKIFIATELYDRNPGTSVTNFCSELATILLDEFKVNPENFIFIEHTPDKKSKLEVYGETFDIVNFDWDGKKFSNPKWERISRDQVDNMIL